jgi:hypothetical protein
MADYECDVGYVLKGGKCILPSSGNKMVDDKELKQQKDEDCDLDGFYYVTQGYRKIPGNMCYKGVQMDPIKKACSSRAWISSIISSNNLFYVLAIGALLYYGWPLIEAIYIVLPLPDPGRSLDKVKSLGRQATGMVTGAMTSNTGSQGASSRDYEQNLD